MATLFRKRESYLIKATRLTVPLDIAPIRVTIDTSDLAMGATIEQRVHKVWRPLAFFSRKFNSVQTLCCTYDRELTAVYSAIREFDYMLEGRDFEVYMAHKPFIHAIQQNPEKMMERQLR